MAITTNFWLDSGPDEDQVWAGSSIDTLFQNILK